MRERPVDGRDRTVGVDRLELAPRQPRDRPHGESERHERGGKTQRPAQRREVDRCTEDADHDHRHEVREKAIVDELVVENVEVGALKHDDADRERSDPRERELLAARPRAHGVRQQPCNAADEGEHSERERERRQMLDERPGDAGGKQLFVLRVPAVDPGQAREPSRDAKSQSADGDRRGNDGEQVVPLKQAADAALTAAQLVPDHRHRKNDQEPEQLSPREVRDDDRHEGEQVVPPGRRHGRALHRKERPDRRRVRRDLGHHHGRKDDPRHDDGEHRGEARSPDPSGDPACQEERRNARGGHDPRIGEMDGVDVVRYQPMPKERRDQQRVELRVAADVDPVNPWDERMCARDVDREPLVAQLVVLREPVERARRQLGEEGRRDDPEQHGEDAVASPCGQHPSGAPTGEPVQHRLVRPLAQCDRNPAARGGRTIRPLRGRVSAASRSGLFPVQHL